MQKLLNTPEYRNLRGFAFDPGLSSQLDTALINDIIFKVRWDDYRARKYEGKEVSEFIGEYFEICDIDASSKLIYPPIDLNAPFILAQNGLPPSESNPQFHQQMVYAVSMTTVQNFEKALGRLILWSPRLVFDKDGNITDEEYVSHLRLYPHAIREANAYYNPLKKAILFGYFPAVTENLGTQLPGGITFTCCSADIISHEVTHAILDGISPKFIDPHNIDSLALHEYLADIVALFQHFTYPEVLKNQIAKTRGDLQSQNLLGELANQFGKAIGNYGSLRDAIGKINPDTKKWEPAIPNPADFINTTEPHDRGAILVAAIFDAFLQIYKRKTADLFRIASNGTGILPDGELHPDLVNRLANEASKLASQFLNICIRGLDSIVPFSVSIGDYLRGLITADYEIMKDDNDNYRIALIDAFRKRGIYPEGIKSLSVDSLRWPKVSEQYDKNSGNNILFDSLEKLSVWLRDFQKESLYFQDRRHSYELTKEFKKHFHSKLYSHLDNVPSFEKLTGLVFSHQEDEHLGIELDEHKFPKFQISSIAFNRRVTPLGTTQNQVVIVISQKRKITNKDLKINGTFDWTLRGGCTLIFDLDNQELLYCIKKSILDKDRIDQLKDSMLTSDNACNKNALSKSFNVSSFLGNFAALHNIE